MSRVNIFTHFRSLLHSYNCSVGVFCAGLIFASVAGVGNALTLQPTSAKASTSAEDSDLPYSFTFTSTHKYYHVVFTQYEIRVWIFQMFAVQHCRRPGCCHSLLCCPLTAAIGIVECPFLCIGNCCCCGEVSSFYNKDISIIYVSLNTNLKFNFGFHSTKNTAPWPIFWPEFCFVSIFAILTGHAQGP